MSSFITEINIVGSGDVEVTGTNKIECSTGIKSVRVSGNRAYVETKENGSNTYISSGNMVVNSFFGFFGGGSVARTGGEISVNTSGNEVSLNGFGNTNRLKVNNIDVTKVILEALKLAKPSIEASKEVTQHIFDQPLKLTDVVLAGSGDFTVDGSHDVISPSILNLHLNGSGDTNIVASPIQSVTVDSTGSGDIKLDAQVQKARLTLNGSGDIKGVYCIQELIAALYGSGDIKVSRAKGCSYDPTTHGSGRIVANVK